MLPKLESIQISRTLTPCYAWNNDTPDDIHLVVYNKEMFAYRNDGAKNGLSFDNFQAVPKDEYNSTIFRMLERIKNR